MKMGVLGLVVVIYLTMVVVLEMSLEKETGCN